MKPIFKPEWDTAMLTNIYQAWEDREGMEEPSCALDRLMFQPDLTAAQREWLETFVAAWDAAEKKE
jgi:hypothetical protein